MFEIIEYKIDENGVEKVVSTYTIPEHELQNAIHGLDKMCQLGVISSYAINPI